MKRFISALSLLVVAAAAPAQGQDARFEVTPFAGYQFGGGYEFDGGEFNADAGLGWGATLSFAVSPGGFVDITYIRQDTKLDLESRTDLLPSLEDAAELDLNFFHIGGHQEFGRGGRLRPYLGGALGAVLYAPSVENVDLDDQWEFSFGINGGIKYFLGESQRIGLRLDLRGLWFWVPSDDYGYWCDFYGCFVVQGTETVAQGLLSGGLVFKF